MEKSRLAAKFDNYKSDQLQSLKSTLPCSSKTIEKLDELIIETFMSAAFANNFKVEKINGSYKGHVANAVLGDAIIKYHYLMKLTERDKDMSPKEITDCSMNALSNKNFASVCRELKLEQYILHDSKVNDDQTRILATTFEAYIYLLYSIRYTARIDEIVETMLLR